MFISQLLNMIWLDRLILNLINLSLVWVKYKKKSIRIDLIDLACQPTTQLKFNLSFFFNNIILTF
jgi:hypothetical protein